MNLFNTFLPWFFKRNRSSKNSAINNQKSTSGNGTSNSKMLSDEDYFRLIDFLKTEYKEKAFNHANEGLSDGAENIPASDSDKECQNEQVLHNMNEVYKNKIVKEYNFQKTCLSNNLNTRHRELDYLINSGLEKYHDQLIEEKEAALSKAEQIQAIVYFFGMKFILPTEKVNIILANIDSEIQNLKVDRKNARRAYLKNFKDIYNNTIPSPRPVIDDHRYWWVFAALFGVEVLISFKSIQFFGQSSNIASFCLALILAMVAAKMAHNCGANLFNLLNYGKDRGKFYATLIISLAICVLLSGFRLNMEAGSFVLLAINLLFTTIAGYFAFLRAEHSEHFGLKAKVEKLHVKINSRQAQRESIKKEYDERVRKINDSFDKKARNMHELEMQELQGRKVKAENSLQELEARMQADLADIENIKTESIALYRDYNRTARSGLHPPVKRWEDHDNEGSTAS